MMKKGIHQVFDNKNCDKNSKLEHVILNGGSKHESRSCNA